MERKLTFVAAFKGGDRIIILSDTKITRDDGLTRRMRDSYLEHNWIPGRLKAFPLSNVLSVAYAGSSNPAVDLIRKISNTIDTADSLTFVLEFLRVGSFEEDVDFIVVSHIESPEIYKISSGVVSSPQDFHWIGDQSVVSNLSRGIEKKREEFNNVGGEIGISVPKNILEESFIMNAWIDLLLTSPTFRGGVGGLPCIVLCTPEGHGFPGMAGSYNPGAIHIDENGITTNEDGLIIDPLEGQYSFSFVSPLRGKPVLGVVLSEANAAYIYEPLIMDEPQKYGNLRFQDFRDMVLERQITAALR